MPANWNGAFFPGGPRFCEVDVFYLCMRSSHAMFLDTEIAKKYGSGPGPEKLVARGHPGHVYFVFG